MAGLLVNENNYDKAEQVLVTALEQNPTNATLLQQLTEVRILKKDWQAGIETIDALEAMLVDGFDYYLQGNIVKYLWRFRYKNGVEDLKKAQWYLNKLIEVYDDKS